MVGSTDIAAVRQAIQADLAELRARPSTALLQSFAERNQAKLAAIKTTLRRLESGTDYFVTISDRLKALAAQTDAKGHC